MLDGSMQPIWNGGKSHPSAYEDFGCMWFHSYYFGCDSYGGLRHWFAFPKVIEYLKKHAFYISKYDCYDDFVMKSVSGVQIAFDLNSSKKVAEYPLDVLLNSIEPIGV